MTRMPRLILSQYTSCFFVETFPEAGQTAATAVSNYRLKKAESDPSAEISSMEDHLVGLSARIEPLKDIGVHVLKAAIHTFRALWPGEEPPTSATELAEWLSVSDDRLSEWRESATRVGADEAMTFVMSWYEDVKLESLQTVRANGLYVTDPELIKKRQERAYSFVPYGNIHEFRDNPYAEESEDDQDPDAAAPSGSGAAA